MNKRLQIGDKVKVQIVEGSQTQDPHITGIIINIPRGSDDFYQIIDDEGGLIVLGRFNWIYRQPQGEE